MFWRFPSYVFSLGIDVQSVKSPTSSPAVFLLLCFLRWHLNLGSSLYLIAIEGGVLQSASEEMYALVLHHHWVPCVPLLLMSRQVDFCIYSEYSQGLLVSPCWLCPSSVFPEALPPASWPMHCPHRQSHYRHLSLNSTKGPPRGHRSNLPSFCLVWWDTD